MGIRSLLFVAASLVLAACAQDPDTTETSGAGTTTAPAVTAPAPAATAPVAPVAAGPVPGSEEEFLVEVGDRVFFDYERSDISEEARLTLDRQALWLNRYTDITVVIEGHCDERGTREYNLALGERRANAVRQYLIASGIDAARIETISYGKERPVALGSDEASWALNRRGVTVIN
ncbi:MAG: peptidoglycan-associated lipoprotein Pal [Alphaproteobacteria bacterium]|nr:peptidoglycan-associated lipoprotein Pal [Alphaproteobacteria bacterium]